MKIKNKAGQYVKNADLVREILDFKEKGVASETLGRYLMMIANGLSSKGNFNAYTWKADMASEAVLTCLKYMKSFDPERGNAFAYITQICGHSFVAMIKKEKNHAHIKSHCYDSYDDMVLAQMEDGETKAICYQDYGEKRLKKVKAPVEQFILGDKIG